MVTTIKYLPGSKMGDYMMFEITQRYGKAVKTEIVMAKNGRQAVEKFRLMGV